MVLPLPLPVLAAGGAALGWLVGHTARGSELAGGDSSAAATTAPTTADATAADAGSSSLDWGQDLSSGGGLLPGASPVTDNQGYDYTNGNYPPAPPPPATPPPPSSTPTTPPPTSAPAPTGTVIAKPRTAPPSGTVGWTIVKVGQTYRNPYAGWNGSYPVKLHAPTTYTTRTARWISATRAAVDANGAKFSVRRVSHRDTVDGQWADDFVSAGVAVYPLTTASVRV